jgi:ATP-binding cassette, subfamily B, bacterial MsbA
MPDQDPVARAETLPLVPNKHLLFRLLADSFPKHKNNYIAAIFAMIVVASTTAATAWVMGVIVDSMNDPANRSKVFLVAGAVTSIFVVKGLASFAQVVLMARAGNRIVADKQEQLYQRLLDQDIGYFTRVESSDVLMRITQSAQRARSVIDVVVTGFVRDLLTLIGLIGVMIYQQPLLSVVCLIVGPASIYGVRKILSRVHAVMAQELASLGEIIQIVQETSRGARVIKSFALETKMAQRMNSAVRLVEKRANKMTRLEAATTPLMDTITGLAIGGIVMLSAVQIVGQPASTAGALMSFVTAFLMAYEPAKRLSKMRVSIEAGMVGVQMMYDLLDKPLHLTEAETPIDLPEDAADLRLTDVHFTYTGARAVIDGISHHFAKGTTTALVGPSGGGKSTLLNLLLRMYDPDQGSIFIGDTDIKLASTASLRRKIAYVGQDTFLFSASVMENLRMVRPDASDDEVFAAARIAHADEFITQMPDGYNTLIGENGAFLSGGQRQRLAIARAVLRKAPILLLDEATSALDSHSEVLVRDALERITKHTTTIVVAHRLSTVIRADQICYLEAGRIAEVGSLSDLLAANGKFRALYDEQFAGD